MEMHSNEEAFKYIESFANLEKNTGIPSPEYKLERMAYMLDMTGHPERSFKCVHIAGSKGKGSTATIAATMLKSQGYKTGLYTSPHLVSYTERITLAGTPFAEDVYVDCANLLRKKIESGELTGTHGMPTTFELLTLMAFLIFKHEKCDWAAIEVGLGGRLDATNLIKPEVCIITPIELEHCGILGDTLEKIAAEKAGIIKQGVPVVIQPQKPAAMATLKKKALLQKASLFELSDYAKIDGLSATSTGTNFKLKIKSGLELAISTNLIGNFQADNIASALLVLSLAIENFDFAKAVDALKSVKLEGRFEVTDGNPPVVIDGSHTEYSVQKLCSSLESVFGNGGVLIFGCVADKNYKAMLDVLVPHFSAVIISEPEGFKKSFPQEQFEYGKRAFPNVQFFLENDKEKALKMAKELAKNRYVVVTGSFYLAGAIKKIVKRRKR